MEEFRVVYMGAIITCPAYATFLAFDQNKNVWAFDRRPEVMGDDWTTFFGQKKKLSRLLNVEAEHWRHSLREVKTLTVVKSC